MKALFFASVLVAGFVGFFLAGYEPVAADDCLSPPSEICLFAAQPEFFQALADDTFSDDVRFDWWIAGDHEDVGAAFIEVDASGSNNVTNVTLTPEFLSSSQTNCTQAFESTVHGELDDPGSDGELKLDATVLHHSTEQCTDTWTWDVKKNV